MHENLNKDFFINKKYICLIVRDSTYLKRSIPIMIGPIIIIETQILTYSLMLPII